jgi:hypothetical protein
LNPRPNPSFLGKSSCGIIGRLTTASVDIAAAGVYMAATRIRNVTAAHFSFRFFRSLLDFFIFFYIFFLSRHKNHLPRSTLIVLIHPGSIGLNTFGIEEVQDATDTPE